MIGLDTNVLVRYIVQDDPEDQSLLAANLIERECTVDNPGFICCVVMAELAWVLSSAYKYDKRTVAAVIKQILSTAEFVIENPVICWSALDDYQQSNAGYADCLIVNLNTQIGCQVTYSFDQKAAKLRYSKLLA